MGCTGSRLIFFFRDLFAISHLECVNNAYPVDKLSEQKSVSTCPGSNSMEDSCPGVVVHYSRKNHQGKKFREKLQ